MRTSNERGIAMITTLLVLMLISALLVGFTTMVMSDQRFRFIDHDRGAAFYAASGGVEKLTADLGNIFYTNVAPTGAQMTTITDTTKQPVITGITYVGTAPAPLPGSALSTISCTGTSHLTTAGTAGYTITFCADANGNPGVIQPATAPIKSGPYTGLIALQTPYQLDVTATTSTGGEVHLARTIESVAIPVFQFGGFSDTDMSFYALEPFTFGGRIHTNGNLWLSEGPGNTLTTSGKITAVKEVIRLFWSNGVPISTTGFTGTVNLATSAVATAPLGETGQGQGSVVGNVGSALNDPMWSTTVLATYNTWLRNGRTGAKQLSLPLVMPSIGGTNVDLIKRPVVNENSTNALLFGERMFTKASLRILLSDNSSDITNLPTVTSGTVYLDGLWNSTGTPSISGTNYGTITGNLVSPALNHPPLAQLPGPISATTASNSGTTVNFSSATAAAPFKPTFIYSSSPGNVVSCTGKSLLTLTGCTGSPSMPVFSAGGTLTQISPATGTAVGASAAVTAIAAGVITMSTNPFTPLPFWNPAAASNTLITCTGYTSTSYTGCSSIPSNSAVITNAVYANAGISPLGGYLKIERQDADLTWHDVTMEILNYGIGDLNDGGTLCPDPAPNAIIRLQRLRDNQALGGGCNYSAVAGATPSADSLGYKDPANWWPMALYDTREGLQRDNAYPGATGVNLELGGIMYYVTLDAGNLAKWFKGTVAPYTTSTGTNVRTDNSGYTVYFSDRRNNRNASGLETAEYGYEDIVNPAATNGAPNGVLDAGEDVNGNNVLDLYGGFPNYNGTYNTVPPCTACTAVYGASYPLNINARPRTYVPKSAAQVNRPIIFRRALKLQNGGVIAPTITGLTIVSENPVYIKGDWNVNAGNFNTGVHAATSIIADAVTLLSSAWVDGNSMDYPYTPNTAAPAGRNRSTQSYYRVAILAGKATTFPLPTDPNATIAEGTDGGMHNFLRMLEGGAAGTTTVNYRGSMATLFFSRQATGNFKCCSNSASGGDGIVYSVPVRAFQFDADFLTPALLPPNTPVFRDMNAVGFSQELRPGK